jgi:hypothetical protein
LLIAFKFPLPFLQEKQEEAKVFATVLVKGNVVTLCQDLNPQTSVTALGEHCL